MKLNIETAEDMMALGRRLGEHCPDGACIYLQGDLGAGKTTLVRGFLHGMGYEGKVKSPTYTLVEPYVLAEREIFHFDLYRLEQPEELEHMGYRDYFADEGIILLEWPEKAGNFLQTPDLRIEIELLTSGRSLDITGNTSTASKLLSNIQ